MDVCSIAEVGDILFIGIRQTAAARRCRGIVKSKRRRRGRSAINWKCHGRDLQTTVRVFLVTLWNGTRGAIKGRGAGGSCLRGELRAK